MDPDAVAAIRAGRRGVHLSWRGRVLEARGLTAIGATLYVETTHLDGTRGPTVKASECRALERTYDA